MTSIYHAINHSVRSRISRWEWTWPNYGVLENIVIGPFDRFSRKLTMNLPCEPASHLLQHDHFEYNLNQTVGRISFIPLGDYEGKLKTISEPVIYGGPLFTHFGHFIAESTHRIWPRIVSPELSDCKVVFVNFQKSKMASFIYDGLELKGVAKSDVLHINKPILFKKLVVPAQARQMSGATLTKNYKYLYEEIVNDIAGESPFGNKIYLSRSRHSHTGSYFGETVVEKYLAGSGFDVIYPEDYSLKELVAILRKSELAVFAEGSAIHALELCGARIPHVFIIGRRPPSTKRWADLMKSISPKWKIYDRIVENFGMSPDKKKHSAFLEIEHLLSEICDFCRIPKTEISREEIVREVRAEVEEHISQFDGEDASVAANRLRELAQTSSR